MKKEVKLKGSIMRGNGYGDGFALIIGGRNSVPYVNLYQREGEVLLASLFQADMDRLVKAWVKVRGGYPV